MQSRRHAPETEETGIDLAPMLDFTTNLLIFFIITTSFIKEAGTVVTKPEAETAFGPCEEIVTRLSGSSTSSAESLSLHAVSATVTPIIAGSFRIAS